MTDDANEFLSEVRQKILDRTAQDQLLAVMEYWIKRWPMFRSLTEFLIAAVNLGMQGDAAIRWAYEQFAEKVLATAKTDAQRGAFSAWLTHRSEFLRSFTLQLWTIASRALPPRNGLAVALEAQPNPDFAPSTHNGSVRVLLHWKPVSSLGHAVEEVDRFIESNELGGGNWVGKAGRVVKDGQPWARISYNRRIWEGWDASPRQELDKHGNPKTAASTTTAATPAGSFKAEMYVHGQWAGNAMRYPTPEMAEKAGADLFMRWTATEKYRVVPSTDPPNVEPEPVREAPKGPDEEKPTDAVPAEKPQPEPNIIFMTVGDKPAPKPQPVATNEEKVLRYTLGVNGVWGRAKKAKFESFVLAKRVDPKKPWELEVLIKMARNKLAELLVRAPTTWRIIAEDWTVRADGTETLDIGSLTRPLYTETIK